MLFPIAGLVRNLKRHCGKGNEAAGVPARDLAQFLVDHASHVARFVRAERIAEAARTIDPLFLNTPQYADEQLNRALGRSVVVKIETANPVRSFKGRARTSTCGTSIGARRWGWAR